MTRREFVIQTYSKNVANDDAFGGIWGCPNCYNKLIEVDRTIASEACLANCVKNGSIPSNEVCAKCWNQEIPGMKKTHPQGFRLEKVEKAVKEADLVIGCVLIPGKSAPKLFKKKYLKEMKPGAVFVDVAVDQGGCGETTKVTYHDDPIFIEDGVVHYCVGNMPGAVPRTSTIALTNATLSYGLQIAGKGLEQACKDNEVIYSAINTYDGKLTCKNVADSFDCYEYTDVRTVC